MKVKVEPEDFRVMEEADVPLSPGGAYRVCRLEKCGWNTLDVLHAVARRFGLPISAFAWGGRKDRHAVTVQYVTVDTDREIAVREDGFSLEPVGRSDRPMGPDLIRCNRFEIRLRGIAAGSRERFSDCLRGMVVSGVENYYDDQRFAGVDPRMGFPGKMMVLGQCNGALKSFLTRPDPRGRAEDRERRDFLFQRWKDWKACRTVAKTALETAVFDYLAAHPRDFHGALRLMPRDEVALALSAWQSGVWNSCLASLVKELAGSSKTGSVRGEVGDYLFLRDPNPALITVLPTLEIPACGTRPSLKDERVARIYREALEREAIPANAFRKFTFERMYLKSFLRRAWFQPEGLKWEWVEEPGPGGRWSLLLRFALPRGCYATMLVKRLSLEA